MEEKEINREQPTESLTLTAEEQQNEISETEGGSLMDKFKNIEALQVAYKNLEKQFTQKCQKVKELSEKLAQSDNAEASAPEYAKDTWESKVEEFFALHPEAKEYADEISEVLSSDEKIANSNHSLDFALTKVLSQKFVPYKTLIKDEKFLNEYVYNNAEISEKIVKDYLDNLSNNMAMPLMSSSSGTGTFSSPVSKPKTIKEAGKVAEAYFNN